MKNNKILLAIIAVLIIASVVFISCSKKPQEQNGNGDGATSSTLSPSEASSMAKELADALLSATRADGTPLITSKGGSTGATDANGKPVTTKPTTTKPSTTLNRKEEQALKDKLMNQVNDYIASHGLEVNSSLNMSNCDYYEVNYSQIGLKRGDMFDECKQVIDFVILAQIKNPENIEQPIKSMYCYYVGTSFYIVFSPESTAQEPVDGEVSDESIE